MPWDNPGRRNAVGAVSFKVEALVRRAHRRSLTLLGIEQLALAACLVFAGSALILLLGTQLLNWYWLLILAATGLAGSAWRLRGRLPSPYRTAQMLDTRLSLHDTISTAWHLNRNPQLAASRAGQVQLAQAEALVPTVDARLAFPWRLQRTWILALALAAVALALFSVRYLVRRDLSFRQALVPLRLERLADAFRIGLDGAGKSDTAHSSSQNKDADPQQVARSDANHNRMSDVAGAKTPAAADSAGKSQETNSFTNPNPDQGNSTTGEGHDSGNNAGPDTPTASEAKDASGQQADKTGQPGRPQNGEGQQSPSLMTRMKDAASSFMAKMRPEQASRSPQSATRNSAATDQDQTQAENGQSQSQTNTSQSSQGAANADSKSGEQGQATEMSQSAQSRTAGNSEHKGGDQSKSGIGKQDGEKDVKQAEELRAMGKLAEIIGKRSQDLSGEMMVEVPSGKQQLKTAYSGKVAQHSDTGGEINRDEIPVAFQQYVRDYMERIHRQPPPPKPE